MLGKTDDVAYYTDLKEKVKEAFDKAFFDPETARYGTGSQASYAMPCMPDWLILNKTSRSR